MPALSATPRMSKGLPTTFFENGRHEAEVFSSEVERLVLFMLLKPFFRFFYGPVFFGVEEKTDDFHAMTCFWLADNRFYSFLLAYPNCPKTVRLELVWVAMSRTNIIRRLLPRHI
jgi:hypothetical protein